MTVPDPFWIDDNRDPFGTLGQTPGPVDPDFCRQTLFFDLFFHRLQNLLGPFGLATTDRVTGGPFVDADEDMFLKSHPILVAFDGVGVNKEGGRS